ncbi:hypothetical protein L1987_23488 [Smallanthus sonchifolius]|uniref:Uncharacterized protein n=1 Tax=Smallanthus sonchifolius TaxID=185202 RepID=A0ACB9IJ54_9ASTR|nr:hypothetical protein L1987_23488 [Smallanthus sonchifolius]
MELIFVPIPKGTDQRNITYRLGVSHGESGFQIGEGETLPADLGVSDDAFFVGATAKEEIVLRWWQQVQTRFK